jgi:hypothetical protein
VLVLHRFDLVGWDVEVVPGLQELRRPKEAAKMVGPIGSGHSRLLLWVVRRCTIRNADRV